MPSLRSVLVAAALAGAATAKTITVTAGSDQKFSPESVTAEKGDVVQFEFEPKNHSVVAGDFKYPCSPMQLGSGFYSGFISSDNGKADDVFRVTINDTEPIPFYSSQGNECSKGMVGIINPSKNQTVDEYKKEASKLSKGVTPGTKAFGGEVEKSEDANKDDSSGSGKGSENSNDSNDKDSAGDSLKTPMIGALLVVSGVMALL